MSIASEITRIQDNISDAYTAAQAKGATMPATQNSDNLATTISTISGGGVDTRGWIPKAIDANGKLVSSSTMPNFTGVEDLGDYALYYGFYQNTALAGTLSFPDLTTVSGQSAMERAFHNCTGLTSVLAPALTTISGSNALSYAFYGCSNLTSTGLSSVKNIDSSLYYAYNGCISLTSTGLSSFSVGSNCSFARGFSGCTGLTEEEFTIENENGIVGNSVFKQMFYGCTGLIKLTINGVKKTTGYASGYEGVFGSILNGCTNCIEFNIPDLEVINDDWTFAGNYVRNFVVNIPKVVYVQQASSSGGRAFYSFMKDNTRVSTYSFYSLKNVNCVFGFATAFSGCVNLGHLFFPALKTIEGTSVLKSLFNTAVNGCTIHFPSNLDPNKGSTVISSLEGYPNFGGTNTVLLFDLPATVILTGNNSINYERSPKDDTATALAWRVADENQVINWTPYYTSGVTDPVVGDTIYSDATCTTAITNISSIA